jgi:glycosyltransferase involved in cell wall biosynthesis
MKKILWITLQAPEKTTGFGVVFYYRLKALKDLGFEVKVANFLAPFDQKNNQGVRRPSYWSIPMLLRSIVRNTPFVTERHFSKEFKEYLLRFRSWNPDIIIAAPDFMAPHLKFFKNRKIIEVHDIRFWVYKQYLKLAKPLLKPFLLWETLRTQKFEVSCGNLSDEQWLIGKDDFTLSSLCGFKNPFYVPVSLALNDYSCITEGEKLLFIGSYTWFPNRDALDYLLKEIWPEIVKKFTNQELLVIGRMFPSIVYNINGVKVLGEVHDLREVWQQCGILVAPLRIGTGVRIKILEAMAMGKAVITTKEGAEGLEYLPGSLVIAKDKYDFIDKLGWLIKNPKTRKEIGKVARKSVEYFYSQERVKLILKARLL